MARQIKTNEQYLGKLLKLIPSEIIAAYMAIQGFIPEDETKLKWGLTAVAVVLLIITPLYLKFVQQVAKSTQIFVSTVSFIIWVYAIGGPFKEWGIYEAWIASAILLLWTTFIPQFFKTQPVSPEG